MKDTWGTETGLLDDYDYFVKEAWFGPNPESDYPDRIYLHLRGPAFQGDELVNEEYEIRFATGDNWEVVGGGDAVEHASGAKKFFARVACGELVSRVIDLAKADAALMKAIDLRGDPTEAATWAGLAFHMELIKGSYTRKGETEATTFYRQLPTAYLPDLVAEQTGAKGKGKAKAKAEPEAKPARGKAAKGAEVASLSDAALKRAIKKFAAEYGSDDFDTFVTDVLDPKEFEHAEALSVNGEVKEWVLDEKDGCWAEVHGD